jgi:nucleotide-binding universal stress UspA family protein
MTEIRFKKILLPIDGSDESLKAAMYAVRIAKQEEAQIICVHAVGAPIYTSNLPSYYDHARKITDVWFGKVREIARKEGIDIKTDIVLDVTSVVDAIVNYAENEDVDLIVMGTRGRTGIKRFLLGSVASGVVFHAHCAVMVVR